MLPKVAVTSCPIGPLLQSDEIRCATDFFPPLVDDPEDFGANGPEDGLAAIGQEALRRRNERLDSLPPGAFRQEAVGRRG